MSDPYLQPDGTLKNKFGVADAAELERRESDRASWRALSLADSGGLAKAGLARLQAIHHHLLQDVYAWAGEPRTINISKAGFQDSTQFHRFTPAAEIEAAARDVFGRAEAAGYFKGLSRQDFAKLAADHFADVNQLHAFREGNGRTQRLYIQSVAPDAGHTLDFAGISHERMIAVSIATDSGNREPMRRPFEEISDPVRSQRLSKAAAFLEANREKLGVDWNQLPMETAIPDEHIEGSFVASDQTSAIVLADSSAGRPQRFVLANAKDLSATTQCNDRVRFVATPLPEQRSDQDTATRARVAQALTMQAGQALRDGDMPAA